ncbi:MAG TPA: RNA polymerase sporulation sigma factor SigH [Clostridiales bacterium]|nr:RNA polymerase sporulation sigma factor SigH [Clostridiales bacterium]
MKNKDEYSIYPDEEIVSYIYNGDELAIDYLLEKYKGLVKNKAKTLFLIGGDRDDLIQEGMIGLYKAIRDYDKDKNTSFFHFADLCISRQIYNAINASNRQKNIPLNTYISLSSPAYSDDADEERDFLLDKLYSKYQQDPEQLIIDKENVTMIEYELVRRLSNLERVVLSWYLKDLSYQEIAKVIDKEPKVVDNALTRIKAKLNKVLNES